MSIRISTRVWEHAREAAGAELLILLALADRANDDGICYPGIASIADKARITERHAKRIIHKLEAMGYLYIAYGVGRKHTNVYMILVGMDDEEKARILKDEFDVEQEKVTSEHKKVTSEAIKGDMGVTRFIINTSVNTYGASAETISQTPEQITQPIQEKEKDYVDYFLQQSKKHACDVSWCPEPLQGLALAFEKGASRKPTPKERRGWISCLDELSAYGVRPEDIQTAIDKLRAARMTICDPYSVRKTALAIAAEREVVHQAAYDAAERKAAQDRYLDELGGFA